MLREENLAVFETWSSRVFRLIQDSSAIIDMKLMDHHVVCELEYPEGVYNDGTVSRMDVSLPTAGEGVSTARRGSNGEASATGEQQVWCSWSYFGVPVLGRRCAAAVLC